MIAGNIVFTMNDGREAVLRSPREEDAEALLNFIRTAVAETDFLIMTPGEVDNITTEEEKNFIKNINCSHNALMLVCFVNGMIAGNCQITFNSNIKLRHKAEIGIAIVSEYWNLGIGTEMFTELIKIANIRPHVTHLTLTFIEGNSRARHLYEKMGFRIAGVIPQSVRLGDGTLLNEYFMIKKLR